MRLPLSKTCLCTQTTPVNAYTAAEKKSLIKAFYKQIEEVPRYEGTYNKPLV